MLAIWKLLWSRPEDHSEEPIDLLLAASSLRPESAEIFSDLSAAHLARAESDGPPSHYLHAVAAAWKSRHLAPSSEAALFNLALCLEKLPARGLAIEAWDAFLQNHKEGPWSDEARQRRRRLTGNLDARTVPTLEAFLRVSQESPEQARDWIRVNAAKSHELVERLLPYWADIALSGSDAAPPLLARVEQLAEEYSRGTGDFLPLETAVWARSLDPEGLAALVALGEGVKAIRRGDVVAAEKLLEQGASSRANRENPLAPWWSYHQILCSYFQSDYQATLAASRLLRVQLDPKRHRHVLAHLHKIEGLVHQFQGSPESAVKALASALANFSAIGEHRQAITTATALAWSLSDLGDVEGAWMRMRQALTMLEGIEGSSLLRESVFSNAADLALASGYREIATLFQQEAVAAAERSEQAIRKLPALQRLASFEIRAGATESALRHLEIANNLLSALDSPEQRELAESDLRLATGDILANLDPQRALGELHAAESLLAKTSFHLRLPMLHLARSRALLTLQESEAAAESIARAVNEIEKQRSRIGDDPDRAGFLDQRRRIYDEAVRIHSDLGEHARAFAYADAARARVLEEKILKHDRRAKSSSRTGLAEVQANLLPAVRLLQLATLSDRTLAWVVSAHNTTPFSVPIGKEALGRLVDAGLKELRSPEIKSGSLTKLSKLFAPIMREAVRGELLIIVPDGPLHQLPFAALGKASGEEGWGHGVRMLISPSAAAVVRARAKARKNSFHTVGRALAVASAGANQSAPPLREVTGEARAVAAIHGGLALDGEDATPDRVLSEAARHRVVHIASHAVADFGGGRYSRILLHGDGEQGWLLASRIASADLSRTELVVLSACSTAQGKSSPTEGAASLARAFLAAGVDYVIATLWDIDDKSAADFSLALHEKLASGLDPVSALRWIQIELSSTQFAQRPEVRAAFQVYGSHQPIQKGEFE